LADGQRNAAEFRTLSPIKLALILLLALFCFVIFQDVRYATLLSELVYRAAECHTEERFAAHVTALESELGASLPNIKHHKTGGQR
jgi:hypothetical protein